MRAGAARREKRQAKRALARAERGTQKYKDQKGAIRKAPRGPRQKHGRGVGRRFDQVEETEHTEEDDGVRARSPASCKWPSSDQAPPSPQMVVVQNGKAKRVSGAGREAEAAAADAGAGDPPRTHGAASPIPADAPAGGRA